MFLIEKRAVEGRLDVQFYGHEFNVFDKIISQKPYKKFNKIYKSVLNGYDFRDYKESGTPYLKVANIRKGEFDFKNLQFIDFNSSEISKKIQLLKGNLLLTRKGTFGNAIALNENYDYIISSEVFYIEIKKQEINYKFLEIFFNSRIGQAQFDKHKIGAIMGSLSQEALSNLKIPTPSFAIQNQIVSIMETAYITISLNEQKVQSILQSIDDYLLEKLGISKTKSETQKGHFYINARDLSGNRFDPKSYLDFYDTLRNSIEKGKYETVTLRSLITQSSAGDWGKDEGDKIVIEEYTRCLVIRATEFDNDYNLNLDRSRTKYRMILKEKLKKLSVQVGDLLIEKSGGSENQPVGRISIIEQEMLDNETIAYSNFIHKIRIDTTKIDSTYLFCFLKTMHNIKLTEVMQSQTNGIRNLIMREYLSQKIPLPPLDEQKRIATVIYAMRHEAKTLQQSARLLLENTKKEIETIIIG